MNKVETTKEITDFINFNSVDIAQLKNDNADIYNAFSGLLLAIDKQYGSGVLVAESIDKSKKKNSLMDGKYIKNLLLEFEKNGRRIKFLPIPIMQLALDNQISKGNKANSELPLDYETPDGNFQWEDAPQGIDFWTSIFEGDWDVYFDDEAKWKSAKAPATKLATKPATSTASTSSAPLSNWKPTWKADGKRPSPTRSASAGTAGEFGIGNDGYWYVITKNKANVQQWKKSAQTFKTIINSFKNISKEDLNVYADQLKYSMVGLDKSDDIYKELENDLKTAVALTKV